MTTPILTAEQALEEAARVARVAAREYYGSELISDRELVMDGLEERIRALASRIPPVSPDVAGLVERLRVTKIPVRCEAADIITRLDREKAAAEAEVVRMREALTDTTNALAKFVDTEAKLRLPYEHPLSAYDRARTALKGESHD